jgi:hypothetical protein
LWLERTLTDSSSGESVQVGLLHQVAVAARHVSIGYPSPWDELRSLQNTRHDDPEEFLDIIHAALQVADVPEFRVDELDRILYLGGSVWRATEHGLERVNPVVQEAFDAQSLPRTRPAPSWSWRRVGRGVDEGIRP